MTSSSTSPRFSRRYWFKEFTVDPVIPSFRPITLFDAPHVGCFRSYALPQGPKAGCRKSVRLDHDGSMGRMSHTRYGLEGPNDCSSKALFLDHMLLQCLHATCAYSCKKRHLTTRRDCHCRGASDHLAANPDLLPHRIG